MNVELAQIIFVVMFWMTLVGIASNAIGLCIFDYPRTTMTSIGWDVAKLVIGMGACVSYAWILGWFA